ncbi:MAG: nucleotidyltransferase [Sphingobacteriaceae bacterium]|nr:nucleotidyltransferase [Sphingobacteriaceae bacterium]
MESQPIAGRIARFLADYPPFDRLNDAQRRELAAVAKVRYAPVGTVLFKQNEAPGAHFYMVAQGSVRLSAGEGTAEVLIDLCDMGDVFGVRPMLVNDPYMATAEVVEESVLYAFPWATFAPWLHDVPGLALFFAAGFASGLPVVRNQLEHGLQWKQNGPAPIQTDESRLSLPVLHRPTPSCAPQTPVMLAATIMRDARADHLLVVNEAQQPLGILTDTDLRNKVATGQFSIEAPVSQLMSQPVFCVKAGLGLGELQLDMLERNLHHLVVTTDGTPQGKLEGVITDHDLLAAEGSSAGALHQAIRLASSTEQLVAIRERLNQLVRSGLQRGLNTIWLGSLTARLQDMLVRRLSELLANQLRSDGQPMPQMPFVWLQLGSGGRKEQLLPSDQDHALLFEDPDPRFLESVRAAFLLYARRMQQGLEAMGFVACPAQMMASNPQWCLSLSEWKAQFSRWLAEPDPRAVMMTTIFFDFRPVVGESALAEQLRSHIAAELPRAGLYLSALAKNACENPPPLGFFRQFMVEKDGEHRPHFDLKARAMMPLADAARVLWLQHGLPAAYSTPERFEAMARLEPAQDQLYHEAARSYEVLLRYRALAAASGQPLDPAQLSKIDRQLLRSSFQPIHDLQEVLQVRFQTSWLR